MSEQATPARVNQMRVTKGKLTHLSSTIVTGHPVGKTEPPVFARRDFEDALDKVSRPQQKPERAS